MAVEQVPEWADRRCDCGGYLDEDDVPFTLADGEKVCEGCFDAIASVE